MTLTRKTGQHRRLDVASLLLLASGLASGIFAYWLVSNAGINVLVMIPSVVAATVGAVHLTKLEAPHR